MCSMNSLGQRPLFKYHWPESCVDSLYFPIFQLCSNSDNTLHVLQHVIIEGSNTKVSEKKILAKQKKY